MTSDAQKQPRQLRSFGLLVGGIFAVIGLWPLVVRGSEARLWAIGPGVVLVLAALTQPRVLGPVHRLWMALGDVLGWVNTRVLLGLVFYGLITPMGVVMRLVGRDPMARKFSGQADTYRVTRRPRPAAHMTHQF